MKPRKLELKGLLLIEPDIFNDNRGMFVKTFHDDGFKRLGIHFQSREEYFSVSHSNVLRGMHFQIPPADHDKIVYCMFGEVLDVVLDIRKDSSTYGKSYSIVLNGQSRSILYIPRGFAHGFLTLQDQNVVVYKTTREYEPQCDKGILWNSFGFMWPVENPVISDRDSKHPKFNDFSSPF